MAKAAARRQPDEGLRAALLLRVSDPRQADADAYSLDAQRDAARELCERRGWTIVREYIGAGESAFTRDIKKRETVRLLLNDATSDVFDVLVVHDLSRYARDEELGHSVLNNLQVLGIKLVNASNDVDYDTPEGRLMFGMELSFSAASSRKASFHIKKSKQQKFEMGLHVGDVPFGYANGTTNKEPLVVIPEEVAAIREAFRDRAAGAGYIEIARNWNTRGLKPRSKQGHTQFTASAIQSILENDFYCGCIRHLGERRKGLHEAIVSEDLFLAAQSVVRRQPTKAREPRLLAGLTICAWCGGPIWQHKGGAQHDYAYYREASQRQQRPCAIAGSLWLCDQAEARVERTIRSMALDQAWLAEVDKEARRVPEPDDGRRSELEQKKKRATSAYVAGELPDADWREILGGPATGTAADRPSAHPCCRRPTSAVDGAGVGRHDN